METELENLRKQAEQLFEEEKYDEIIALLSDDLLEKFKDAELFAWMARAHGRLEELDKRLYYAQKAIGIDPNYWMGYFARGYVFYQREEFDKAITDYNKVIDLNPDFYLVYFTRGATRFYQGLFAEAISDLDKSISLKSDYASAYHYRGVAYHGIRDYNKAIANFNEAIQLKSDAGFNYSRGLSWYELGDFEKAVEDYNTAIDLMPDYAYAYNNRGIIWLAQKEYDKALKDFNLAISSITEAYTDNQQKAIHFRNRGETLQALKRNQEALRDYEKAVDLDPQNSYYRSLRDNLALELGVTIKAKNIESETPEDEILTAIKDLRESDRNELNRFYLKEIGPILRDIRELSLKTDDVWREAYGRELKTGEQRLVAHYSSLQTADVFVMQDDVKMRYSNAVFMNDPEEGKILIECMNDLEMKGKDHEKGEIWKSFYNVLKNDSCYYYIGSFMPVAQGHEDELLMWRTYGKDENQNEAAGCSIVLDTIFFDKYEPEEDKATSLSGDKSKKGTAIKQPLQRVFYYNKRSNEFSGKSTFSDELMAFAKKLEKSMSDLLKKRKSGTSNPTKKYNEAIEKILYASLSEVRYIFKSADYSYESELRMVQFSTQMDKVVKIDMLGNRFPRRMFVESNNNIRGYIKKIVLGPKVAHPSRWMYLEEKLKHEKINAKVIVSECMFQ